MKPDPTHLRDGSPPRAWGVMWRRWRPALAASALLLLAVAVYRLAVPLALSRPVVPLIIPSPRIGHAAYSSCGGRFVVVQHERPDARPAIGVWDRETSSGWTIEGYALLAIEPHAPVAWIESRPKFTDVAVNDEVRDPFDDAPKALMRLRLDSTSHQPEAIGGGAWSAWESSSSIAVAGVDPSRGAWPSTLSLGARGGMARPVALPTGALTFRPLGWSASGRYFAIEQMLPITSVKSTAGFPIGVFGDGGFGSFPDRLLVILDAQTGATMATAALDDSVEQTPVWAPFEDAVYYLSAPVWDAVENETEPSDEQLEFKRLQLVKIRPGDTEAVQVLETREWEVPLTWQHVMWAKLLGTDDSGIAVEVGGEDTDGSFRNEIWLLGKAGPVLAPFKDYGHEALSWGDYGLASVDWVVTGNTVHGEYSIRRASESSAETVLVGFDWPYFERD